MSAPGIFKSKSLNLSKGKHKKDLYGEEISELHNAAKKIYYSKYIKKRRTQNKIADFIDRTKRFLHTDDFPCVIICYIHRIF